MNNKFKTGVLLINLGTPDKPHPDDVKIYLKEFLNDPRVIDIPSVPRHILVNYIIIPKRYKNTTELYQKIWTEDGSPLLYYTKRSAALLQDDLGEDFVVKFAMRYRNPSVKSVLDEFNSINISRLIIIPLFPQYASATVGSIHEEVFNIIKNWQVIPELKIISQFHADKNYIESCAKVASQFNLREYDHILFSYHGLPERQIKKADNTGVCLTKNCCDTISERNLYCYRAQCVNTSRLIASQLEIEEEKYTVCFQSRLGKEPWIKPYADETIIELAQKGYKKLLVFSPSFVADCLETIYEIGIEYDQLFKENGGESVTLVPGLNDSAHWIYTLKEMVLKK